METDSSRMYRLLGWAREYLECQFWIGNEQYLTGRRVSWNNVVDLNRVRKGYEEVMDWIVKNTMPAEF